MSQDFPEQSPAAQRKIVIVTLVLAVVILVPSMVGFVNKFIEFTSAVREEPDTPYVLTPVVNYLFATAGFFCFLIWSTMRGMFKDIEAPKRTMLETDAVLNEGMLIPTPEWAGGPKNNNRS